MLINILETMETITLYAIHAVIEPLTHTFSTYYIQEFQCFCY